jgi:hypothetical protein
MAQRLGDTDRFKEHRQTAVKAETERERQIQLRQVAIESLQMKRDKKFANLNYAHGYASEWNRTDKFNKISDWYEKEYEKIVDRFRGKL